MSRYSKNSVYVRRNGRYVKCNRPVKPKHKTNDGLGLFIILALLIALGLIAVNDPDPGMGYSAKDIAAVDQLITDSTVPRTNAEKLLWLFADDGKPINYQYPDGH